MKKINLLFVVMAVLLTSGCGDQVPEAMPDQSAPDSSHITAFTHVNVVPMTVEVVLEDHTVLVDGARIVAVGPAEEVLIPQGAQVIDGEGLYLMPGLADMHIHTRQDWTSEYWPVSPLLLYLANGVTTVRDFGPYGEDLTYVLRWRDEIAAGTRDGPMIYTSGTIIFASPLEDPAGMVRENYTLGFDFLKLYSYLSVDDFRVAISTAKELGMYTAGHIPYPVGLELALAEGMEEIAHVEELLFEFLEFDQDQILTPNEWLSYIIETAAQQLDHATEFVEDEFEAQYADTLAAVIEQLLSADVPVCTTLVVDDVIQVKLFQPDAFLARPENQYLPSDYLELFRQGEEKHLVMCRGIETLAAFKYDLDQWLLREMHSAGVPLLLGTDSGTGGMGIVAGFSIHDELRILVENGFSPYEAIATGTVNASRVVRNMVGEGDFGVIEVGRRADLLLLYENPLEDVGAVQDLVGVMAAGRWYSREALDRMIAID